MLNFGLISEGPTDQIIIERIIHDIFSGKEVDVNMLQPKQDETGNWDKVLKYIQDEEFRQAFQLNDYIVIHLDTDVMRTEHWPKTLQLNLANNKTIDEQITEVIELLNTLIPSEDGFMEEYGNQIIFAIAVDSVECWILPFYFENKPAKAAKTTGCIDTLNEVLRQKEGFYLDKKDFRYYRKMGKRIKKVEQSAGKNPSLEIFVSRLIEIAAKS